MVYSHLDTKSFRLKFVHAQTILKVIKISPLEFVSKRLESKQLCIETTGFQEKIRCLGLKPKKVNILTDRNEPLNYKVTSL